MALTKLARRARIKMRIRKIVSGTTEAPRLTVFRSNKQIYAQIVNDTTLDKNGFLSGATLVAASSTDKEIAAQCKGLNKTQVAALVGKAVAAKAVAAGITSVAFDRNGYLYHGRVKQLADAAREGGLKF